MQQVQNYLHFIMSEMNMDSLLWTLCCTCLVYLVYRGIAFSLWYRRWFLFFNSCPGITRFSWRNGNLNDYPLNFEKLIKVGNEMVQKFPRYFRVWFGPLHPVIICHHPDTIRRVIKHTVNKPLDRGQMYSPMVPWLGQGILLGRDQHWVRSRKLFTPNFRPEILRSVVPLANEAVDIMLDKIDKHAADGTSFDIFNMLTLCTFDIMLKWAFSVEENIQHVGNSHQYTATVAELSELIFRRNRHLSCHFDWIYYMTEEGKRFKKDCEFAHRWAQNIIEKRIENLKNGTSGTSRKPDFLDMILDSRTKELEKLQPLEIRMEVDNLLFGGHDTTASGSSWILHSLASRPEVQSRIQEEVDSVLADRKSKHITWDDLSQLEYTTLCIKEGLRHNCPISVVARSFDEEIEMEGKVFPVGTVAAISIWNLHHNPQVWDDPYKFDPERFLPQNMKDKDVYSYIPFLAGKRNWVIMNVVYVNPSYNQYPEPPKTLGNCLGKNFAMNQLKIIIGRVLERYDLSLDASHPVVRKTAVVVKAKGGLWFFAKRRKQRNAS